MPSQGGEGKEGKTGITVEHVGIAGSTTQQAGPTRRNLLLDGAHDTRQLAHNRLAASLIIPTKAGNVPVVAVEDAGLGGGGRAWQAATPAGQSQVPAHNQAGQVGHEPCPHGLSQIVVGQPVDLNDDKGPPLPFLLVE